MDIDQTCPRCGFHLGDCQREDFRGRGQDGPGGLYAHIELHAGLICLSSARVMDLNAQRVLFEAALEVLAELPDLINQVLEVMEEENGQVSVTLYELPAITG